MIYLMACCVIKFIAYSFINISTKIEWMIIEQIQLIRHYCKLFINIILSFLMNTWTPEIKGILIVLYAFVRYNIPVDCWLINTYLQIQNRWWKNDLRSNRITNIFLRSTDIRRLSHKKQDLNWVEIIWMLWIYFVT